MTESSFPLTSADLTDDMWGQAVGAVGDGILDDWGSPYAITVNTNDTVTVGVSSVSGEARAVVGGFGHRIDAPVTVSVPAVSAPTTYWVGLLRDPANATNPVKLTVLSGTSVPLSIGQRFVLLQKFVRGAGQTLAAAQGFSVRPCISPTLTMASSTSLLETPPKLFLRGTTVYCADVELSFTAAGTAGSPRWDEVGAVTALTGGTQALGMVTADGKIHPVASRSFTEVVPHTVLITVIATATGAASKATGGNLYVRLNGIDVLTPTTQRQDEIAPGSQNVPTLTAVARTQVGSNTVQFAATADKGSDDIKFQQIAIGVTAFS
ncbi:hypothetical protein [Curtobacterium sp. MCBD17_028]|uniref:hypothetical protein n=1 Tax=Curtobacterium sp. MCBD17_028 TaxID=2175670 RepID=UPI000DA8A544|nr:hypothetical protein [Curtobacterium sp. MCBD17_028]PZE23851.1 hypothetical protein DEI86_13475 [Curtobacterium sp. MCBD17_028]